MSLLVPASSTPLGLFDDLTLAHRLLRRCLHRDHLLLLLLLLKHGGLAMWLAPRRRLLLVSILLHLLSAGRSKVFLAVLSCCLTIGSILD